MFIKNLKRIAESIFIASALALALAVFAPANIRAQDVTKTTDAQTQDEAEAAEVAAGESSTLQPELKDYRGVRIGMSGDEARRALGGSDAVQSKRDVFLISDNEMAQLFFEKDGTVKAISITYLPQSKAPDAIAILGVDVPANPDGRVYKLVRYPDAGYWVSYNRTTGDAPIVTVTIKKMTLLR